MNNKGFSMIELLAVIVILAVVSTVGIVSVTRLVDSSKRHFYETQRNQMVLAAQAYANDDKRVLPKSIGEKKKITLGKLYEKKYIKDKIVDKNNIECYPEDKTNEDGTKVKGSYVNVVKTSKTDYRFTGYLYCKSCGVDGNCEEENNSDNLPKVDIKFPDVSGNDLFREGNNIEMDYHANGNSDTVILSYSYKIYVDGVLKYNSNKKNGKRKDLTIKEEIYKYVPGKIKVVATITNSEGDMKSYSKSKDYSDALHPSCGRISYDNNSLKSYTYSSVDSKECGSQGNPWINKISPVGERRVWVECDDQKGIGCAQHEFSAVFKNDAITDKITIKDTNNLSHDCYVHTCIDKTPPNCDITLSNHGPNDENGWYTSDVTLTINKEDPNSYGSKTKNFGLATTTKPTNGKITQKQTAETKGQKWYSYSIDNAGNTCEKDTSVKLDKTKPSVSISIKSQNTNYNTRVVNVTIKAKDVISGINQYCLTKNSDCNPNINLTGQGTVNQEKITSTTYTMASSQNGSSSKLTVCIKDMAGIKKCDSTNNEYKVYKSCSEKYTPPKEKEYDGCSPKMVNIGVFRWTNLKKDCDNYKRKYDMKQYSCICHLDKYTNEYCSNDHHDITSCYHGPSNGTIYYKHSANGKKACKGQLEPNSYVEQVCNSDDYSATNGSEFDYHRYTFFEGSVKDGYTNFGTNIWTYGSKNVISSNYSASDACATACKWKY